MTLRLLRTPLICSVLAMAATPLSAADISQSPVLSPSAAPAPKWTLGIEGSPEIYAIDNGANQAGELNNIYYKVSLSRRFESGFVGGVSFQHAFKDDDKTQFYADATLGYKFDVTERFSLRPGVGVGYTWKDTGITKGSDSNADIAYYALTLGGDLKLERGWTWNMFDLRYRNGFDATWLTPKVATGVTYQFDSFDAVYLSVGYAWKKTDTESPPYNKLSGDKINFALGYKRSF